MNNIVQPLLRDFNPPYVGKGLVILWVIFNHDYRCIVDIKNGILEMTYSYSPGEADTTHGDGLIAFGLERDIDKNDNLVRHNWVLKTMLNDHYIDLKQYGYEAPAGIPYHDNKLMTDPSYWYRKTWFFPTTPLYPGQLEGTLYQKNMPTFKQINSRPGRNVLGCAYTHDYGISRLLGEGKLELRGIHHGCDVPGGDAHGGTSGSCWGGFGIVINFDIARYNKEKELGILYYNIPNYKIVNNVSYTPIKRSKVC